jgi:hypothetical protein
MQNFGFLILAMLCLLTTDLFATDVPACSNETGVFQKDFRKELGPIQDQGDIGWCYGVAAADQGSHYLFQKGYGPDTRQLPNMLSGAAISLRNNEDTRGRQLAASSAQRAVRAAIAPLIESKSRERKKLQVEMKKAESSAIAKNPALQSLNQQIKAIESQMAGSSNYRIHENLGNALIDMQNEQRAVLAKDPTYSSLVARLARIGDEELELRKHLQQGSAKEPEGGFLKNTTEQLFNYPICRENQVKTSDYTLENGITSNQLRWRGDLAEQLYEFLSDPTKPNCVKAEANLAKAFNSPVAAIKKTLKSEMDRDPLKTLTEMACGKEMLPSNLRPQSIVHVEVRSERPEADQEVFFKMLSDQFDHGGIVGISYDASFLFGKGEGLEEVKHIMRRRIGSDSVHHASTLVGKGFNCETKEEEFILRNTWGPLGCPQSLFNYRSLKADDPKMQQKIDEKIDCLAKCKEPEDRNCRLSCRANYSTGVTALNKPPFRCTSDGYFIVPKSVLATAVTGGHAFQ